MKIEFRKIPNIPKEFEISSNSVKFLGIFSKITNKLVKIEANIIGDYDVECCKCGNKIIKKLNEKNIFIISDGIFSSENNDIDEEIIVEVDNHIVDFDEILQSELESIKSDYYICDNCTTNKRFVDIEF